MAQVYMSGSPMYGKSRKTNERDHTWDTLFLAIEAAIIKVTEQFATQICEMNDWHREIHIAFEYWDMEWKMPLGWQEENNMLFYKWNKHLKVKTGSLEYEMYGVS
ncbi:hypothetical protein GYMLUDRAFT_257622 [Collybiopsis luxurians FD-317 M1]|nr:hypothetical protein GYMLUDRAFT_257622 [Collybiopsis luxurians FD-317 M1]